MNRTEKICLAALLAGVCVVFMALSSLVEVLDLSLAILAGLVVAMAKTELGTKTGLAVFGVAGVLSLFLPQKGSGILFCLFCGWYPLLHNRFLMLSRPLSRLMKEGIFNVILVLYLFLSVKFFGAESRTVLVFTFILGNIAFLLYDLVLDRFELFYLLKIRPRLGFDKRRK